MIKGKNMREIKIIERIREVGGTKKRRKKK
jgi:hypothetical protein